MERIKLPKVQTRRQSNAFQRVV